MPGVAHPIVIVVYVLGAACEIAELLLTVTAFLRDNQNGTADWSCPPAGSVAVGLR